MKSLLPGLALLAACVCAQALPGALALGGSPVWSISEDGSTFVVLSNRNGDGLIYRTDSASVRDLGSFNRAGVDASTHSSVTGIVLTPDGSHLFTCFAGPWVVVRDVATGSMVWQGALPFPFGKHACATAVHFRTSDRRLRMQSNTYLASVVLPADGAPAPKPQVSEVSFDASGRTLDSAFVQAATFAANGDTLFLGTKDGEVLQVDVSSDSPRLKSRVNVFERTADRGAEVYYGYVGNLGCSNACKTLLIGSTLPYQVATLDVPSGRVRARLVDRQGAQAIAVSPGLFVVATGDYKHHAATVQLLDADFKPVMRLPELDGQSLAFGFKGGVAVFKALPAVANEMVVPQQLRFVDVQAKIDQQAENARAALERAREVSRLLPEYRRRVKSGDDSHCGLVVERKGDIALVETPIGPKWLKVRQLYPAGSATCTFVNGVLQE